MTDAQRVALEERRRWCLAISSALDVVGAAASTVSPELALPRALAAVERIDQGRLRLVAAALAVDAVWQMPPTAAAPDEAGRIYDRQQQLREWIWDRRRHVAGQVAKARQLLKEAR